MIFLTDILKEHKELNKSFIYDVLKSDIPFSNEKKGNKRYFTDEDIEKFLYIKDNNIKKAIAKYGTNSLKQSENNIVNKDSYIDNKEKETVGNIENNEKITELEKVIFEKSKEITRVETWNIDLHKINKVAKEDKEIERKEKNNWIEKYDKLNEKYEGINIKNTKLMMILLLLLFILIMILIGSYLYISGFIIK